MLMKNLNYYTMKNMLLLFVLIVICNVQAQEKFETPDGIKWTRNWTSFDPNNEPYSESEEILSLYPVFNRIGVRSIAMTSNPKSSMARLANYHLCIAVPREACPLGLAPTASSTATLVMGDALAVALLEARGFTADDFALSHPGGTLGKKLLLSGLMPYDEAAMQSVCDNYDGNKQAYAAIYSNDESSLLASEGSHLKNCKKL